MKAAVVFGTRPEAIKMAPVVKEIERRGIDHVVIVTAQHREMLDQKLDAFDIEPHYDLNIMRHNQDLFHVTAAVLNDIKPVLEKEQPNVLLVQGDTTTTFAASLASFYLKIPVGHVEAGLRTWNKFDPFPEEINRQLTTRLTDFHFAPTNWAKQNLLNEGVKPDNIFVTGNTVIDALLMIVDPTYTFAGDGLGRIDFEEKRIILLTSHRRENFGEPMVGIFSACRQLVEQNADVEMIYPVHPNPNVQKIAKDILSGVPRVHLIKPMEYRPFVQLMNKSYLILTDSGGVQEEAPTLGKPVLVLRKTTERPEAIEAGTAKLVGTDRDTIVREGQRLLSDANAYREMATKANPYGDGKAAGRIVDILLSRCP
ncbi:MAG: UDP-N-acetylglucosamine 2-epimerase (non-hydrolyzing) [Ignavibacteriae bacterium]|nr:UDP-N-acetylglucosamine 2-epimerase (non-hydrolyzing) [Ignavibacteria bacterium]MBI3365132.1 UDP-N-acetylglucosamine 2-epimerase (non-hydrolyzing) [Ignavibacteriota bacterium]